MGTRVGYVSGGTAAGRGSHQRWLNMLLEMTEFLALVAIGTTLSLVGLHLVTEAEVAHAQSAVHSVGSQTVQGNYNTGVYEVKLGSTQAVNISFLKSGETIQKVWLDDPSRIVIDFDGCLVNTATESGSNCQQNGARFIHVRQLRSEIALPEEMSTGEGGYSLMTILTDSGKVYQIQLVLGTGRPPYSLVEINPAPPSAPAQLVSLSQQYQQEILGQLSRGLAVAEAQGLIDQSSAAYTGLRQMIALMQSGTPFADAQQQSNTPTALISRLRGLGSQPAESN